MGDQPHLNFVKFTKDAYIVVEGKRDADCFFIIREGKVRLFREVQVVPEMRSDILNPGDFFGVVSTMSEHSQIETAQALTDVVLISVHRDQFCHLIQNTAQVAMKIILQFSQRVRFLNDALTRITLKANAGTDTSVTHLFDVAEYYARQGQFNLAYYAYCQYIKYCPNESNIQVAQARMEKAGRYRKPFEPKLDDLVRTYPKDTMIFSEGEPGQESYVIKSGMVKIVKIAEKNEVLLAVLKTGDIFGEMALLESKPRTACAVAYEECQLMVLNKENFGRMITTQPQLIARLTTLLAERIWLIYKQLANTKITDPLARVYDMMLMHLEKKRVNLNAKAPFAFDFGPKELMNMIGLSHGEGDLVIQKLLQNKRLHVVDNKIEVTDVTEIVKQCASFRRIQEIESRKTR